MTAAVVDAGQELRARRGARRGMHEVLPFTPGAGRQGVLVAFHDRTLDRVTDRAGRISRLPHREVSAARIGSGLRPPLALRRVAT